MKNIYPTLYSLLIAQDDLWQAHYHTLSIILLKEFIELNVNMGMLIQDVKRGIKYKIAVFSWIYKLKLPTKVDEKLNDRLFNAYKFSNDDNKKLLLQKGVYPYVCIGQWEKFNETLY